MPRIAPYGTWSSPITAEDVAAAGGSPQWLDVVDGDVWWAQPRPDEGGRIALLRARADTVEEMLPAPWNARNRVHEYGGRPWLVTGDALVFTHWDDQRVYRRDLGSGTVEPITPEPATPHGVRYADLRPGRTGEVWAVREAGTGPRRADVTRDLVSLSSTGGEPRVLAASNHFLTAPQLSPGGRHAAWLGWDHPAMPWDGTSLCVAEVAPDGTFGPHRVLAGGPDVAVCQLEWESADTLLALLDPDGWWNLHRIPLEGEPTNLAPVEAELGGALWRIGSRWFTPLGGGRHAVLDSGRLAVLDEHSRTVREVPAAVELTAWSAALAAHGTGVAGIAAGPRQEASVVHVDLATGALTELTPATGADRLPRPAYLPVPEERVFTAADGAPIPAYVYPPANPDHSAPDGERPPFLVHVHGGPTGRNHPVLDLDFAYFTSRGIGVVAVNYGGSTGYGRRFRERLRGQWGVVDVRDCVAVAEALVAEGVADGDRLAVRGGSAGGFTSAASMTTVRTYRAGTVKFPILDLHAWTADGGETHDFESHYLDGLVGPLPEAARRYRDRSPLHHAADLAGPVLFLQGLEDEICPPEQADRFVDALKGSGVPHAYLTFPGEQHGFRKAETIVAALTAELSFYGQVLGFDTPGVPRIELRR
ncbi:Dipeptidyl aminopeptidase/acylaminoacyl peptidase [Amycolatopsis arida]|uniref:Dipeptidyl aminopeptidase/acylaminoacyl peptidase n=1 Tax=Amycolatopsis arida TaxID=587909 RepID=A0A1I5ZEI3_9PSEU|nr:prolyl oligopeptidase family serine peptidase [Amycolatopsis arida]TDX89588.1 dipeptidyl aminopeptidase/acylaminoacyl peptidase [Amycolatopsis arida]SFQ54870.1 Dipeptidyl aminopeptidase/acylaminoacyl peptidase [Amycolatopsis arida]